MSKDSINTYRRTYLSTAGGLGLVTLAGCSSIFGDPEFELNSVNAANGSIIEGKEAEIEAIVENTGEAEGETEIEIIADEVNKTETVEIDANEKRLLTFNINTEGFEHESWYFTIAGSDISSSEHSVTIVEPEPAEFTLQSGQTNNFDLRHGEGTELEVTVENTGDISGTQDISLQFEHSISLTNELTLQGGEETQTHFSFDASQLNEGTYFYEYQSQDDSLSGGEVYIIKCPSEDVLRDYSTIGTEDLGYNDVERVNVDVRLSDNGDGHDDSELIDITRSIVCELTEETEFNAIGVTFWDPGQFPGFEQAYGECNWGPDGSWFLAGSVETGDYSTHEYSLRRF